MISTLRRAVFLRRFPAVVSPIKRAFSSRIDDEFDPQIMNINELNQVFLTLCLLFWFFLFLVMLFWFCVALSRFNLING